MRRNDPVNIQPVGNGFLVEPGRGAHDVTCVVSRDERLVFLTIADLARYLGQHFDQPKLEEETP